jgi:hypothetical protein
MTLKADTFTILLPSLVKVSKALAKDYFLFLVSITKFGIIYTQAFLTPQTFYKHFSK